jgi:hypothetical protein
VLTGLRRPTHTRSQNARLHGWAEQRAFGVAQRLIRVVVFGTRCGPARMRMRCAPGVPVAGLLGSASAGIAVPDGILVLPSSLGAGCARRLGADVTLNFLICDSCLRTCQEGCSPIWLT